jgi:coenzyme F420-reducing hydrogenase beta subunit
MIHDMKLCVGCSACVSICPLKCISMEESTEGFLYPVIDQNKCMNCGKCTQSCPMNKSLNYQGKVPETLAAINNDANVRRKSSSGGIFSLLAETVILQNGIVFGAAFDKDFKVKHVAVAVMDEVARLYGSKYVQSDMGECFQEVKKYLEKGRLVLFSGTPCQINGLKAYLNFNPPNLICVDFICYGVPSPAIFEKYKKSLECVYQSQIRSISFRDKKTGWSNKNFASVYNFANKKEKRGVSTVDLFYKSMCEGLTTRFACSSCQYKSIERSSDITLADFWGIGKICPQFDDGLGTSLVMVHTEDGKSLIGEIENKMRSTEISIKLAILYNQAAQKAVLLHPKRRKFFEEVENIQIGEGFLKLLESYLRVDFAHRVARKFRSVSNNLYNKIQIKIAKMRD